MFGWIGKLSIWGAAGVMLLSAPVRAQQFTTAAEIRPILEATQGSWVAVREYEGQDLLYFTHLLAWRCGLEQVQFSVNGGEMQVFDLEPCYVDEAQPNAIKAADMMPFQIFDLKSVNQVDVLLTYDDGETGSGSYERAKIQIN